MSARDELLREMTHNHLYMDDERAQELVDAYAHELAERQRKHVRRRAAHPLHYGSADWAIRGVDEAADLIDPKAQRASTEGDTP